MKASNHLLEINVTDTYYRHLALTMALLVSNSLVKPSIDIYHCMLLILLLLNASLMVLSEMKTVRLAYLCMMDVHTFRRKSKY